MAEDKGSADVGTTQDNKVSEKAASAAVAARKKDAAKPDKPRELTNSEKMGPYYDPATEGERDLGDREAVPAGKLDRVFTSESKARWEDGQPQFGDLLKASNQIDQQLTEQEAQR